MLVEKLIKETVELQGFRISSVVKGLGELLVTVVPDLRYSPRCGKCGTSGIYRDVLVKRSFRHVPLWGMSVTLKYAPRRVTCPQCGSVHVESLPWAIGKRRMTKAFAVTIATWARLLPWLTVAKLMECSWTTVSSAVEFVVEHGLVHRDLSAITHIGIDEISRQKGHVYLTNVYDLNAGTLIWSGEGRTKETLTEFFTFFGEERAKELQGVCCDMWPAYISEIKAHAPNALLVFDKFHIISTLGEAVDKVRRQEAAEKNKEIKENKIKEPKNKDENVLVGTRYIWLKNPWNLTDKQKSSLSYLENLNLKIHRAYLLKESFRDFWQPKTKELAKAYLNHWCNMAVESKLEPMQKFVNLLKDHEENILTYFDMKISNGIVEGLNNKAKVISHRAYGFRSAKNYILNLYHCMADLQMPKTMHRFT